MYILGEHVSVYIHNIYIHMCVCGLKLELDVGKMFTNDSMNKHLEDLERGVRNVYTR